eukprot:gene4188-8326_t
MFSSQSGNHIVQRDREGTVYGGSILELSNLQSNEITAELLACSDEKILVLRNVFTVEECNEIIKQSEGLGFEDLGHIYPKSYRKNDRVIIEDKTFVSAWYDRMRIHIEQYVDEYKIGKDDMGEFEGMNSRLRLCKYGHAGVFQRHRDAHVAFSNVYSHFTVMAYLNSIDQSQGGATRFFSSATEDSVKASVQPECGLVVIFPHKLFHDGELCLAKEKYVMRSDLLFRINNKNMDEEVQEDKNNFCVCM